MFNMYTIQRSVVLSSQVAALPAGYGRYAHSFYQYSSTKYVRMAGDGTFHCTQKYKCHFHYGINIAAIIIKLFKWFVIFLLCLTKQLDQMTTMTACTDYISVTIILYAT